MNASSCHRVSSLHIAPYIAMSLKQSDHAGTVSADLQRAADGRESDALVADQVRPLCAQIQVQHHLNDVLGEIPHPVNGVLPLLA